MPGPLARLQHLRKQVVKDRLRRRSRVVLAPLPESTATPATRDYLSVCAIMKNEGSYLREWLEFHRLVGVDHFYLYDNGSDDNTAELLAPYVEAGIVTCIPWPRFIQDSNPQYLAYAHCMRTALAHTFWLAVIDLDEFLFSPATDDVREVLRSLEAAGAIAVFRREFATCGHRERPPGPVIANYRLRQPDVARSKVKVKSIVRPGMVRAIDSAHRFELVPGVQIVDETLAPLRKGADGLLADRGYRLRVNHYFTKSLAEYRAKVMRGRMVDRNDWESKFASQVDALEAGAVFDDTAILRLLPRLEARLASPAIAGR